MATLILRPNGVGDYANIEDEVPDAAAHWTVVDEVVADDADYVAQNVAGTAYDVYALENTAQAGIINSVTVYFRCRRGIGAGTRTATPRLRLGASETTGTEITLGTSWTLYNEILARPGGGTWSWTDVNALQAGVGLYTPTSGVSFEAFCSQLYIVVTYMPPKAFASNVGKLVAIGAI